jgi:3-deoxy-D-manno-octulosonic acid kinase
MNPAGQKTYGSYRFESTHNLTDAHLAQLTAVFDVPTQTGKRTLEGRTPASAIRLAGIGPVIVKHYRRGGLLGYFVKRTYLKCGKTRCQVEYSQLKYARHSGISVPEPIACVYKGHFYYQAWLITREIPNQQSLARLSLLDAERTASAQKKLLEQMVLLIDNHIHHTDLHPGNVLVDTENRIFIIDFDKAHYYMRSRINLQRKYIQRWNRAVHKHNLPETLYLSSSTFPPFDCHKP